MDEINKIVIYRDYQEKQTAGQAYLESYKGTRFFEFKTLELPFLWNRPMESCVIANTYPLIFEFSGKFGRYLYELYGTPGRSECKFHTANYVREMNGCIAPGKYHTDMDNDGIIDVANSGDTLDLIHQKLMGQDYLIVEIH